MAPKGAEDEDVIDLNDGASAPDAPTALEITDFDATTAKLKWKAPLSDGGSTLTGYILEYKKRGDDEEWAETDKIKAGKYPNGCVDNLDTGCKYEFRVVAVSRAGRSAPSEATMPQLIKAQKQGIVLCKVNQQMVLEVPMEGAPPPETKWFRGDQELSTGDGVKISHAQNLPKLMFMPAKRPLSGKYTLKAKNAHGEDSVEVEIKVFGKPSAPRGPLEVSDITKKTCLLSWKIAEDDGGYPITHYEVERLDPYMDTWLPQGRSKGTSLEVKNLMEGKTYKFLVRAVNKEGDSPELEMEESFVAKNPFDPPSQPGKPEICDWGESFADLRWNTPERDGGAEITSYRIEMRNRDRRGWQAVGTSEESDTTISDKIEPGNEYEFRIIALNKAGESDHSKSSKPMTAEARYVKAKINRDQIGGEKTLYAGQSLRLAADVTGTPKPNVSWWGPSGAKLENSDAIKTEFEDDRASIVIEGVQAKDSGNYKLKAKNSEGADEVEVLITIIGPPSKPQGPLEVSNVTSNSCLLSWKKPEMDGGSAIKLYQVEKKSVERDTWVPCAQVGGKMAAVMRDLECEVSNLLEGAIYMFRVCAVNSQGESDPLECFVPVCAAPQHPGMHFKVPNQPATPRVKDCEKNWVKLEWFVPKEADITHYIIEKQEQFLVPKMDDEEEEQAQPEEVEGEGAAEQTLKTPQPRPALKSMFSGEFQEYQSKWMQVHVTDDNEGAVKLTDLGEGHKYRFRLRAVNSAGASDPSEATKEVVCRAKQRPIIDRKLLTPIRVSRGENIVLNAKFTGDPVPERRWAYGKIQIEASNSVTLVDKDHTSKLTLLNARKDDTGQYEFKVENEFGQETALLDVTVMVEPGRPKGPMRIFDVHASGCTCSWQPPEDDGGSPVTSYIVERSQGGVSSWTPCGRTEDTTFKVTGLAQDKEYRLQGRAEGNRVRAENSEGVGEPLPGVDSFITENPFGAPCPPGRPEPIEVDADYILVVWDPPRHDGGSRITGYQLEARKWRGSDYYPAGEVRMQMERCEVRPVELGQAYAVRVRALNAAGESSWSIDSEQIIVKHRALKPKISFLQAQAGKELVVKEGETLTLVAEVEAEPEADEVDFTLRGSALLHDPPAGIIIEHKPNKSKVQFDYMVRSKHCGQVSCAAMNTHGRSVASFNLVVQSAPSMPQGILEVTNIHKNGCKLTWEPSKDDGGLTFEYVVEKLLLPGEAWATVARTTSTTCEVKDLEHGREYDFRVNAANAVGESDALFCLRPIVAKDNYTIPLPPSAPEITDWSERHMNLVWNEPIDDGGAPIMGYHIDARLNGQGDWQLWETVSSGKQTEVTIQGLNKGTEYQFRVIALNKAGRSNPSHPSRAKEARPQSLAPSIDARNLFDQRVVAGERVKLVATVQGEPRPDCMWYKDGAEDTPITSNRSKAITVDFSGDQAKLVFNNITKDQEGTYHLLAENTSGKESAKVSLSVLDRPQPPESLDVSLASPDETSPCPWAALVWKRSRDDGGAPIEYYQVERFEVEKGGWLAVGRSKENNFDAKGLVTGHEYRFRVSAVNKYGYSDVLESTSLVVGAEAAAQATDANTDDAVRNM